MQKRATSETYSVSYSGFSFTPERPLDPMGAVSYMSPASSRQTMLHYHNAMEIGLCATGSGVFFIDGEVIPFRAPCCSLIYEGQVHIAQSSEGDESRWTFVTFQPGVLLGAERSKLSAPAVPARRCVLSEAEDPFLTEMARVLVGELEGKQEGYLDAVRASAWLMLVRHRRQYGAQEGGARPLGSCVGSAINYISTHYGEELTAGDIAAACGMSESTLRRCFFDELGMPPMQYLHKVRVSRAAALLSGGRCTVLEAALAVGYGSPSSFYRQFRREYGTAPRTFRQEVKDAGPRDASK